MTAVVKKRFFTWKLLFKLFLFGLVLSVIAIIAFAIYMMALARTVPSVEKLAEYNPPVTSRVHAGDGTLIYEFADEHRVFVPYEAIPDHVVQAFVSSEDKNFFTHNGLDYWGILRGGINSGKAILLGKGGLQGGSTITQQVAKNMALNDRSQHIERKLKEAIVAMRMEEAFSKEHIIELYLNEIYLGGRSYGVGSAALNYFNKSLPELSLSEAAVLASLPKFPGRSNPYTDPDRVVIRRNYVLGRMVDDGYVSQEDADAAKAQPLRTTKRLRGPEYAAATYFVQELRKQLVEQYGEEDLEQGGLSIRTTIDTKLQLSAQEALQIGLETYDRRHDYRGPVATLDVEASDIMEQLKAVRLPGGYGSWERAMVTELKSDGAIVMLSDAAEVTVPKEDLTWAQTFSRKGKKGLQVGDVILVEVTRQQLNADESGAIVEGNPAEDDQTAELPEPIMVPVGNATLKQVPEVDGALVALDPHTGRVLAMIGGYSFYKSSFNRVTQAKRQPGSSFKPFVYAAALEHGYTPATSILDSPYVYYDEATGKIWKPQNYAAGRSYGEVTMRRALEKSFNQVTARVATDIGMDVVSEFAERFGIYDSLPPYPAMSLGSGETTPWRMARAYASFVNGGKEVTPTLLDRIQDRHGKTLYKHDERACEGCDLDVWDGTLPPPHLEDQRAQLVDPVIAYQVVHMLQGVVDRGTGRRAKRVGKPLAGKTGTTNDYVDALFFGFSPDLVVGIWVGKDTPESLGEGEGGGSVAGVIFTEFMERALEDKPALPFRIPPGVRLVSVDADTGELPTFVSNDIVLEAFRPGTEPGTAFKQDDESSLFGSGSVDIVTAPPPELNFDPDTGEIIIEETIGCDPTINVC